MADIFQAYLFDKIIRTTRYSKLFFIQRYSERVKCHEMVIFRLVFFFISEAMRERFWMVSTDYVLRTGFKSDFPKI